MESPSDSDSDEEASGVEAVLLGERHVTQGGANSSSDRTSAGHRPAHLVEPASSMSERLVGSRSAPVGRLSHPSATKPEAARMTTARPKSMQLPPLPRTSALSPPSNESPSKKRKYVAWETDDEDKDSDNAHHTSPSETRSETAASISHTYAPPAAKTVSPPKVELDTKPRLWNPAPRPVETVRHGTAGFAIKRLRTETGERAFASSADASSSKT